MGFLTLSFLTHFFLTQPLIKEKEARTKVLASQLSLDCRARRSG